MRRALPLSLTVLACLAAPAVATAGAPLVLSPQPGTPDASIHTQISILGPGPRTIGTVTVVGSRSGRHAGRLRAYSGNRGASFVPATPFAQGELVRVHLHPRGNGAVDFSFTTTRIGVLRFRPGRPKTPTKLDPARTQAFVSRPDLHPPRVAVTARGRGVSPGDVFITPLPAPPNKPNQKPDPKAKLIPIGPGGPMLVDGQGNLVWFDQVAAPQTAANFAMQSYQGSPVLTWWLGSISPLGFGYGVDVIADSSYRTIATIRAGNGYRADLHDFQITPQGDALITIYAPIQLNLSSVKGPKGAVVLENIVQEVDIKTGLVVYEWHSLGHLSLREAYDAPVSVGYDPWHLNSIQQLADGNLVVSARNTWSIFEIERGSGRVLWRLGGKRSSYAMGPGTRFAFQHDARLSRGGILTLYDDGAGPPVVEKQSRGLVLKLDSARHTATVVRQYARPGGNTLSRSQGNMQTLPAGNVFVGFGAAPFLSEFSASGKLLFDAHLPSGYDTYRAYRSVWTGTPSYPPTEAVAPTGPRSVTVDASWNGATQVASWQVLAGPDPAHLSLVASAARTGFETAIAVQTAALNIAVRALDASGHVLGVSAPANSPVSPYLEAPAPRARASRASG